MNISFSPPDIRQEDIDEVVDTLKSGWITTGPRTKKFEENLSKFCNTHKTAALSSATASLELSLRLLGIGPEDEVITSAYTYTASASVVCHVGAKLVLVDTKPNSFHLDFAQIAQRITKHTKAIIAVDIGGVPAEYDELFDIANKYRSVFEPKSALQSEMGRIAIIADAAHSLGAQYKGKMSGSIADFSAFSFHAVKNLTTAEGGAVTWNLNDFKGIKDTDIYKGFMLGSLHGQSKDALEKTTKGSWEYDILDTAYKYNMTDVQAALGISQLKRYPIILERRNQIIKYYNNVFEKLPVTFLNHNQKDKKSSGHLYLLRLTNKDEKYRNKIIQDFAKKGIATNVHYKPLPMFTAYKKLGFNIKDFPNAFNQYKNEISIPLHTCLRDEQLSYITKNAAKIIGHSV